MITDDVVKSVRTYLEANGPAGLNYYGRDREGDKEYPCVTVIDDGPPEEHEVLKGTFTLDLSVTLETIPEATTDSQHHLWNQALVSLLADDEAMKASLAPESIGFDSWGGQGNTEPDEYRQTTIPVQMTARPFTGSLSLGSGGYTLHAGAVALMYQGVIYSAPIAADRTSNVVARATGALAGEKILRVSAQDDDHNAGNLAIWTAAGRLVVAQCDHNAGNLYIFIGADLSVENLPDTPSLTVPMTAPTYSGSWIHPGTATMDTLTRETSGAGDWTIARTDLSVPSAQKYGVFKDCYVDEYPEQDGSGVWMIASGLPIATRTGVSETATVYGQRLCLSFRSFADDSITTSGGVQAADFKALAQPLALQVNNVLTYTDKPDAWPDRDRVLHGNANTVPDRFGTTNMAIEKLIATASPGQHRVFQPMSVTAGKTYQLSVFFRPGGVNVGDEYTNLAIYGPSGSTSSGTPVVNFDGQALSVLGTSGDIDKTYVEPWPNGWVRVGLDFTADSTVANNFYLFMLDNAGDWNFAGNGADGVYVAGAMAAELPPEAPIDRLMAYNQVVTTAEGTPTVTGFSIYDAGANGAIRLLGCQSRGDGKLDVLFTVIDGFSGVYFDDGTTGTVYHAEVDTTVSPWTSKVSPITASGDGFDDGPGGSKTYVQGWPTGAFRGVIDRLNIGGDGISRLSSVASTDNGGTWALPSVASSSTEDILRPRVVLEQQADGTLKPSQFIVTMEGPYDNYIPLPGGIGFETDVTLRKP